MGLILNLAVIALALAVLGSLALLAWTLAVTAVRAIQLSRQRVSASRESINEAEARLRSAVERATATLSGLAQRTTPGDPSDR